MPQPAATGCRGRFTVEPGSALGTRSAALPASRFHDLRRTYTSYRLAAGIDPKTVQDEVGHKDSRMTMDCYGRALRDPEIRAWAVEHFRFPWDPALQPLRLLGSNCLE